MSEFTRAVHAEYQRDQVACLSAVWLAGKLAFAALVEGRPAFAELVSLDRAVQHLHQLEAGAPVVGIDLPQDTGVADSPLALLRIAGLALAGPQGQGFLTLPFDQIGFQAKALALGSAIGLCEAKNASQMERVRQARGRLAPDDQQLLLQTLGLTPEADPASTSPRRKHP